MAAPGTGLIVAGALVGASGIVLTRLMCKAMNRSLVNVLFAAVGQVTAGGEKAQQRSVKRYSPVDGAMVMSNASLVIIVPGYGMAVAQAQHAVKELADLLTERGVTVKYGIHPVAGRMPGHMNVLLAEAEVPYEQLCDLDEINPEFERADAVLTIGANDVINPAARHDKASPIYGMPILNVDKARTVMICKRSLSPGFAGIDNELFYDDKTMMLFGDGKAVVTGLVPVARQQQEYEQAFSQAVGGDSGRDVPQYYAPVLQRTSQVDEADPEKVKWTRVPSVKRYEDRWVKSATEIVSLRYVNGELTGRLGSLANQKQQWGESVGHPKIPLEDEEDEPANQSVEPQQAAQRNEAAQDNEQGFFGPKQEANRPQPTN
ncbi:hypothetical protein LCGC14_2816320, partial [marine sediment metagenome]